MLALLVAALLLASPKELKVFDTTSLRASINSNAPILFFADWEECPECDKIEATIIESAKQYNGAITIGKMNIDQYQEIPLEYKFYSAPRFVFFYEGNGIILPFSYNFSTSLTWCENKISGTYSTISSEKEFMEAFPRNSSDIAVVMVASADDNSSRTAIRNLWLNYESYKYYYYPTQELKILGESAKLPTLLVLRSFDLPAVFRQEAWNITDINDFVVSESIPVCSPFSDEILSHIYKYRKDAMILFRKKDSSVKQLDEDFKAIAKAYKGAFIFTISDYNNPLEKSFADFMNVKEQMMPAVALITSVSTGHPVRYRLLSPINKNTVDEFIHKFHNKDLLDSEEEDEVVGEELGVLTAFTINNVINQLEKTEFDYVILACNTTCRDLKAVLKNIGKQLVPNNKKLRFGFLSTARKQSPYFPTNNIYYSKQNGVAGQFEKMTKPITEANTIEFIEENIDGFLDKTMLQPEKAKKDL